MQLGSRLYIIINEAIVKILKEEKEYSNLNYFHMKTALDYEEKYLQNKEGDMFLTVNFLIEVINLILVKNNTELRKVNVKPAGYATSPYFPWWCVESSLYILLDEFNERRITNRVFCDCFMEIHPFLDKNGRTCKLLFTNKIMQKECTPCCLIN